MGVGLDKGYPFPYEFFPIDPGWVRLDRPLTTVLRGEALDLSLPLSDTAGKVARVRGAFVPQGPGSAFWVDLPVRRSVPWLAGTLFVAVAVVVLMGWRRRSGLPKDRPTPSRGRGGRSGRSKTKNNRRT
jgi:hypothetical protein